MELEVKTAIRGKFEPDTGFYYARLKDGKSEGYEFTNSEDYSIGYDTESGEPIMVLIEDYRGGKEFVVDTDPPFLLRLM